jgi:hypothetical protein
MRLILLILALCLTAVGADALPPFARGGASGGGGGSTQACDPNSTNVCAQFQNGQTFITWPDVNTGAAGANDRYRIVRSTSPITSGNYGAATVIASYVPNNSGQLVNGDPANSTDPPYTQSYRQDGTRPMVMLTDVTSGGTQLAPFTGLQVYTALATQNAYYAVIKTDTSDANPVYLGSVGPIAESVGTPKPIKWAASGSRGQSYGNITNPNTNTPVVLRLHQSNATGGCSNISCIYGDYWAYFIPAAHGAYWYDGAQINFDVLQAGTTGRRSISTCCRITAPGTGRGSRTRW